MEQKNESNLARIKSKLKLIEPRISKNILFITLAIVLLAVSFLIGMKYGVNKEKNVSNKATTNNSAAKPLVSNRWNAIGIISEINESNIKVIDPRKKEYNAQITKDTMIVDRKGTKLTTKDLKKDQKVIISGDKNGDKFRATRIRIQN